MRTAEDVLRSLKRYVWVALGEDYEVRLAEEDGAFTRPSARVVAAADTSFPDTSRFLTDVLQPFAIYAYPPAGQDAEDARLIAARTQEALFQAFKVGVADGAPDRVPIFDYDGIPSTQGVVGRGRADYARISNFTLDLTRDPTDNRLYTVVANLRLRWRRTTGVVRGGRVLEDVEVGTPSDVPRPE